MGSGDDDGVKPSIAESILTGIAIAGAAILVAFLLLSVIPDSLKAPNAPEPDFSTRLNRWSSYGSACVWLLVALMGFKKVGAAWNTVSLGFAPLCLSLTWIFAWSAMTPIAGVSGSPIYSDINSIVFLWIALRCLKCFPDWQTPLIVCIIYMLAMYLLGLLPTGISSGWSLSLATAAPIVLAHALAHDTKWSWVPVVFVCYGIAQVPGYYYSQSDHRQSLAAVAMMTMLAIVKIPVVGILSWRSMVPQVAGNG